LFAHSQVGTQANMTHESRNSMAIEVRLAVRCGESSHGRMC